MINHCICLKVNAMIVHCIKKVHLSCAIHKIIKPKPISASLKKHPGCFDDTVLAPQACNP